MANSKGGSGSGAEMSQTRKLHNVMDPHTAQEKSSVSLSVRKIYIECVDDLSTDQKQNIRSLGIGVAGSLKVFCKAENQPYVQDQMGM